MERKFLNEKDAAAFVGRKVATLQTWRCRGGGPPFISDPKGGIHYDPVDLERWIRGELETDIGKEGKP